MVTHASHPPPTPSMRSNRYDQTTVGIQHVNNHLDTGKRLDQHSHNASHTSDITWIRQLT